VLPTDLIRQLVSSTSLSTMMDKSTVYNVMRGIKHQDFVSESKAFTDVLVRVSEPKGISFGLVSVGDVKCLSEALC